MFDFHMHSSISFDSETSSIDMAQAALQAGLREICFTDHYDCHWEKEDTHDFFTLDDYRAAYEGLSVPGLIIRRGVEMGLTHWNRGIAEALTHAYPFDFVIGSLHYVDGYDPYEPQYWDGKTMHRAYERYLEETLRCVRIHDDFDVLGHLTYVCKSPHNPYHLPVFYEDFADLTDDILRELVKKGKGMEINTSGIDRVGDFLPTARHLQRFYELGGRIVTVGSDTHNTNRVGQYTDRALDVLKDIFGHVCTFAQRTPTFHRL
ncbi:MAG: histidinol-phosphatase HisJ family protein [Clostridia bacterium]|nr:histidinol-phosphatase HisJ family protein [Clostridia bacterium]